MGLMLWISCSPERRLTVVKIETARAASHRGAMMLRSGWKTRHAIEDTNMKR